MNISEILIGKTALPVILLYYAFIIYAAFFNLRKPLLKKIVCSAAITLLFALLLLPKWQRTHSGSLTLTALDVGHGQAILAQLPDNTNIFFDSGSLSRGDVGSRVVVPFLRYKGIKSQRTCYKPR